MLSQKHNVIFSNNVLRENITRKQFKSWLGSQTALVFFLHFIVRSELGTML